MVLLVLHYFLSSQNLIHWIIFYLMILYSYVQILLVQICKLRVVLKLFPHRLKASFKLKSVWIFHQSCYWIQIEIYQFSLLIILVNLPFIRTYIAKTYPNYLFVFSMDLFKLEVLKTKFFTSKTSVN